MREQKMGILFIHQPARRGDVAYGQRSLKTIGIFGYKIQHQLLKAHFVTRGDIRC
jgi:hypothetical protein